MKFVTNVQNKAALRAVVIHDLRSSDIIVSQDAFYNGKNDDCIFGSNSSFASNKASDRFNFGCCLCHVPTYDVAHYGPLPCFLVEAIRLLQQHEHVEGLFRLSGSSARQRDLRVKLDEGYKLPDSAAPHDVACLLKQFIREIPNSLIPISVHNVMVQCCQVIPEDKQLSCLLMACLLLPRERLIVLRFLLQFLYNFSLQSHNNRMDVSNIVLCLTPNVFHSWFCNSHSVDNDTRQRVMQAQNDVMRLLVENAGQVGMVSEALCDRMAAWTSYFSGSDDEHDDNAGDKGKADVSHKKKKKRRSSLKGLVTSLSSSFSRWRRDSKSHNSSDISGHVSTLSCPSLNTDDTVDENSNEHCLGHDHLLPSVVPPAPLNPLHTPKVMHKRKADDPIAFSAAKRRAILQNLPNMSALAGGVASYGSTSGKLDDTCNDSATTPSNTTGCSTPCQKLEKLLSPSCKPRRKSGRFTPSKRRDRGSICGNVMKFLRRVSGGKGSSEEGVSSPLLVSGEVADGASSTPPTGYLTPRGAAKGRPVQLLAATSIQSQSAIATPATLFQAKQRTNLLSPLATDTSIVATPYTQLTFNFNAFAGQPMMPHEALASSSNECSTSPTRHSMLHSSDSADQLRAAPSNGEDGENDNNVDTSVHDEAFLELEQSMVSCRGTEVGSVFEEELTGSVVGDAPAEVCSTIDTEASVDKLHETAGSVQKNSSPELSSFDAQDSVQALGEPVFVVAEAASTGERRSELSESEVSSELDCASNVQCSCADEAVTKSDENVLNCETSNAGLGVVSDAENDKTITETSCTSPVPCQTPSEGYTSEACCSPTGVKTPSQSAIAVNTYDQSLQMNKSISQIQIAVEKNATKSSSSNIGLSTNLPYTSGEKTSLSPGIGMNSNQAHIVVKDAILPQVSAKDISQSQLSVGNISQSQSFVKDINQSQSSAMKISQSQIIVRDTSQSSSAFNNTSLSCIAKNINQPHVGMGTTPIKNKVKSAAMLTNDLSPIVPDNLHAREIHQRSALAKSTSEPVCGYDQRLDDLMSITLPSSQHASFNMAYKSLANAIKPPSSALPAANVSLPVISSTSRHMCISARNQLPARIEQRSMLTVMPTDNRCSTDAQQSAHSVAPPAEASTVCSKSHHRKHTLMPQIGDRFPK